MASAPLPTTPVDVNQMQTHNQSIYISGGDNATVAQSQHQAGQTIHVSDGGNMLIAQDGQSIHVSSGGNVLVAQTQSQGQSVHAPGSGNLTATQSQSQHQDQSIHVSGGGTNVMVAQTQSQNQASGNGSLTDAQSQHQDQSIHVSNGGDMTIVQSQHQGQSLSRSGDHAPPTAECYPISPVECTPIAPVDYHSAQPAVESHVSATPLTSTADQAHYDNSWWTGAPAHDYSADTFAQANYHHPVVSSGPDSATDVFALQAWQSQSQSLDLSGGCHSADLSAYQAQTQW
ncbi:hypothetical protein AMAG_04280 [Allomyces macrogynus ATCC 38327]|uniref:Uncharacterized protein n=1 Tax=Allomyces macrogynus (strain ATCC 38327) TaxID=578462 RepID=A0A0L0S8A8_ALLM3|nr:hypothetical protein AMAG_04280 [Allomyces macrogynus ATCC 38327]|eukprot:KNE58727.1 hypothetical protein AMAG_04280 [Allomyces macrogynus ATCC 38327]